MLQVQPRPLDEVAPDIKLSYQVQLAIYNLCINPVPRAGLALRGRYRKAIAAEAGLKLGLGGRVFRDRGLAFVLYAITTFSCWTH